MIRVPEALLDDPRTFDFFAALRRLEESNPDRPRIGEAALPSQEIARLRHLPSLAFGTSALTDVREAPDHAILISQFLGLLGPNGPMPLHVTEYVFDRLHNENDPTPAAFLDIFHHRLLTLFYRAWARSQPQTDGVRRRAPDHVGAFVGIGQASLNDLDMLGDDSKRFFAAAFAHQRRDAESLGAVLTQQFQTRFEVQEFSGAWLRVPEEELTLLGGHNAVLGVNTTAGSRIWSVQHRFRLRVHALSYDRYAGYLPGQPLVAEMVAAVRLYTGDEQDWDYQLLLERSEIPQLQLGGSLQLGWNTWLGSTAPDEIAEDAVITPDLSCGLRPQTTE
ncbi:MAG: type VI secretion system baseplate subunit TssG [Pseudomonadota bacterium]